MTSFISTLQEGKEEFYALLKKRMSAKGDFPSLSKSVHDLAEMMQNEDKSISEITGAILGDFALTQKVIRLSNSPMYAGMGGEKSTVSRAAMVLGFDAIAHLALSVRFVDTLSASAPDTPPARMEMSKALIAGDIARNITHIANLVDGEEAVVCALMHHLGRLLMAFYFPEEWSAVQKNMSDHALSENQATLNIIGVTLDEISQEVALGWRLPNKIANSMLIQTSTEGINIPGSWEWLKTIANFAGEAASIVIKKGADSVELAALAERYNHALMIPADSIMSSVNAAIAAADDFALLESVAVSQGKPADSVERLNRGVCELIDAQKDGMSFGNGLNLVLETMYSGMGFNRVVVFLRDKDTFKGRVGFGAMMPGVLPSLGFSSLPSKDVFHVSLAKRADIFIKDATEAKFSSNIPVWFSSSLPDVRAFILLPMIFNDQAVGLLYGDWREGASGMVEKNELRLIGTLRDHLMKLLTPKKH